MVLYSSESVHSSHFAAALTDSLEAAALAVSEAAAAAPKAYSETAEGATAAAAVGILEAVEVKSERMREKLAIRHTMVGAPRGSWLRSVEEFCGETFGECHWALLRPWGNPPGI